MVSDHALSDFTLVFAFLFSLLILYLLYSVGFLSKIEVKVKRSPFQKIDVVYKFTSGDTTTCRQLLSEVQKLAPYLDSFIMQQRDPYKISGGATSHAVGAIVGSNEEIIDPDSCLKLLVQGYSFASFPAVDSVVMATFPYANQLSIFIGIPRVYPLFKKYIGDKKLCAHPIMEIFTREEILFVAPLSRQGAFYVPEAIPHYSDSYDDSDSEDETRSSNYSRKSNSAANTENHMKNTSFRLKLLNKFCKCDVFNRSHSCEYCKRAL